MRRGRRCPYPTLPAAFSSGVNDCHFFPKISYVKAGDAARCILRDPGRRNYTLRFIVTWGPLDQGTGGLFARPTSMTHRGVPLVVALIWLATLNGGMIFLLPW